MALGLLVNYQDDDNLTRAAIELKFFKKENHREPNNRYDVFKDLSNLEMYKQHDIDLCYFILATDHSHSCSQGSYSSDTADFDFRHDKSYKAKTVLKDRTAKPYGVDLALSNDYVFRWDNINDLYFLKVKI
jgi:hypothetical protein